MTTLLRSVPHSWRRRGTRAFSMIELTVVLALLGLMAGAVVLSLKGPLRSATLQDACDRVLKFDALARSAARLNGAAFTLSAASGSNRLTRDRQSATTATSPERTHLDLPAGYRFGRILPAPELQTAINPAGRSATYAIEIIGPHDRVWILVAGLSGEGVRLSNEKEVEAIFAPAK